MARRDALRSFSLVSLLTLGSPSAAVAGPGPGPEIPLFELGLMLLLLLGMGGAFLFFAGQESAGVGSEPEPRAAPPPGALRGAVLLLSIVGFAGMLFLKLSF